MASLVASLVGLEWRASTALFLALLVIDGVASLSCFLAIGALFADAERNTVDGAALPEGLRWTVRRAEGPTFRVAGPSGAQIDIALRRSRRSLATLSIGLAFGITAFAALTALFPAAHLLVQLLAVSMPVLFAAHAWTEERVSLDVERRLGDVDGHAVPIERGATLRVRHEHGPRKSHWVLESEAPGRRAVVLVRWSEPAPLRAIASGIANVFGDVSLALDASPREDTAHATFGR